MTSKGIIFSAAMVRALITRRKTQTRRLLTAPNDMGLTYVVALEDSPGWFGDEEGEVCFSAGYKPGDRLYVRESYFQFGHWEPVEGKQTKGGRQKWGFVGVPSLVRFDEPDEGFALARSRDNPLVPCWHRRLGRFMPRNLSRMWLAVTDVRVQRLQECSEADAIAEGIEPGLHPTTGEVGGWRDYSLIEAGPHKGQKHPHAIVPWREATKSYETLWNSLHTADGERWQDDPWVCALTFEVQQGNIDVGRAA